MKAFQMGLSLFLVLFLSTSIAQAVSCNAGDTEASSGTVDGVTGTGNELSEGPACNAAKEDAANQIATGIQTEKGNCEMLHDYFKEDTLDNGTCDCTENRGWVCNVYDAAQDWVCCDNGSLR